MANTPKILWIDRNLIRHHDYIALCLSNKAFRRECRRLKIAECDIPPHFVRTPQAQGTAWGLRTPEGKLVSIVCIANTKGRTREEIYGLLVHEAVHLWQRYCEDVGESEPSREFEAYSIQALAQGLMQAYHDMTRTPSEKK